MTVVLMAFEVRRGMGESSPFLTLWEEDRGSLSFFWPYRRGIGKACPFGAPTGKAGVFQKSGVRRFL